MTPDNSNEKDSLSQVLSQYGQSMIRVGQLEKELELAKNSSQASTESSSGNNVQNEKRFTDLQMKLENREQEIVALRLQLETVQGELNETKTKLKLAAEGNYIRHRKNRDSTPAWKKLLKGSR